MKLHDILRAIILAVATVAVTCARPHGLQPTVTVAGTGEASAATEIARD